MKKYIACLITLGLLLFVPSCTEPNTPEEPTGNNPSNPGGDDPSAPGGDDPVKEKPAYVVEIVMEYTNVSEGLNIQPGIISKMVYERGNDPKYLLSLSQYNSEGLSVKTEYTNINNAQYGECTYCNTVSATVGAKDTTIYWDEARTLTKEVRSKSTRNLFDYDQNGRLISNVIYVSGKLYQEWYYSYANGMRCGAGRYFAEETVSQLTDTIEYLDLTYDNRQKKRWVIWTRQTDGCYQIQEYNWDFDGRRSKSGTLKNVSVDNKGETRENLSYFTMRWYDDWSYTQSTINYIEDKSYTYEYTCRYVQ